MSQPSDVREPLLQTFDLSVHYGDRSGIEQVSLRFEPGQRISLVGPNGAGKSTLLKAIAGVLTPSHGSIRFDGAVLDGPHQRIVYVPQRAGMDWTFPQSVLDVVLMARRSARSRLLPFGPDDKEAAMNALAAVGLTDQAHVQIGKLSGGQQQRMFLARALLQDGDLYLLDEPFSGVDYPTQELVSSLFGSLVDQGRTIVFATHDLAQAEQQADMMVMLNRRLIAVGDPAQIMSPETLRHTFGSNAPVSLAEAAAT